MVREDTATGEKITQSPDGSAVKEHKDGSKVHADAAGNITEVERTDGKGNKFEYDSKGEMTGFTEDTGKHYRKQADGTFESDPPTGKPRKEVSVDGDGNVTQKKSDGGVETTRPDGTVHIEYPNGTTGEAGADRQLTSVTTPDGRKMDMNRDGSVTYDSKGNETLPDIVADSLKADHAFDPKYSPSESEIKDETERIKALNPGLTEPIAAGTKVVMVPKDD